MCGFVTLEYAMQDANFDTRPFITTINILGYKSSIIKALKVIGVNLQLFWQLPMELGSASSAVSSINTNKRTNILRSCYTYLFNVSNGFFLFNSRS